MNAEERAQVVCLTFKHRLPSWNEILSMSHWERHRYKKTVQGDFSSMLRAGGGHFSTTTTSAKSLLSIAADTLDSYRLTRQTKRKYASPKSKFQEPNPR